MFTRSVAHNWIAPIKSAEGQGCFPRRAHGLFLAAYSRDIYICVCVYYIIYIYIYISSTVKIQYFTGADNLDGYAGSVFSSAEWNAASFSACTITPLPWSMKTYGSIFQAETEGTICPVKESYYTEAARKSCRFTIEGRKEEGERHGSLEARNDLPKWIVVLIHVEFEVKMNFLNDKNI